VPYVAADVETTGLDPRAGDRICEVGFVRFLRGVAVDSLVSLVNPDRPISPGATAVNGITDEMVAGAPSFADLLPRIVEFLSDDPLVFHNAPFDLSFLADEARRCGGEWPANPFVDTLPLARKRIRSRRYTLPVLCGVLGIEVPFHRAGGDAWAAGKLLLHLLPGEDEP
jgi:DNA polymerase-3 subunit epsilon